MLSYLLKGNLALSLLLAFVCASIISHTTDISPGFPKISILLLLVIWLMILSKLGKSSWIKQLRKKIRNKKEEGV